MMISGNSVVLTHLDRLTDDTGMIQHAIYGTPRRESGYTTDDNARALSLCVRLWNSCPNTRTLERVTRYLSFLEFARCTAGGFHNFLGYDRRWLDAQGGGDCQGQAIRALAEVLGSRLPEDHRDLARELLAEALPTAADLRSVRAQAYVILAWGHLWTTGVGGIEPLETVAWFAAQRLVECFRRASRPDWPWFEGCLTYGNAVLPHALFLAARHWPKEAFLEVAEASFAFLEQATTADQVFWPIGNAGWYPHGEDKALYDQQPIEAATMADAALAGYGLLGTDNYLATLHRSRAWFHGQNSLQQPVADAGSGACCDGLQVSGVNRNQGAESTIAYLWTELLHRQIQSSARDRHSEAAASA